MSFEQVGASPALNDVKKQVKEAFSNFIAANTCRAESNKTNYISKVRAFRDELTEQKKGEVSDYLKVVYEKLSENNRPVLVLFVKFLRDDVFSTASCLDLEQDEFEKMLSAFDEASSERRSMCAIS